MHVATLHGLIGRTVEVIWRIFCLVCRLPYYTLSTKCLIILWCLELWATHGGINFTWAHRMT